MSSKPYRKVFGVALDASDDPLSLQLKQASMMVKRTTSNAFYADPYDATAESIKTHYHFELAGKFPIPSWLGPRPLPTDHSLLNLENFRRFSDSNGFLKISEEISDFVREYIFPELPVMIGIDHSSTGGVVSALSERYGSEKISVIVLDRHFDAIAPSLRMDAGRAPNGDTYSNIPYMIPFLKMGGIVSSKRPK
jgi:hypothetical protein